MNNLEENSEFRSVHAANYVLDNYIRSNRDIRIIKDIPFDQISRYDVWQTVFSEEKEAYRELEIKEWYSLLIEYSKNPMEIKKYSSVLCITLLTQTVEWNSPLKIQDEIKIILDIMGDEFLDSLISDAEDHCTRRMKIVEPYHKKDNEWVGYSKTVLDILLKFKNT